MTLKLTIEREVQPREIVSLVFGTGALTWEWWHGGSLRRPIIKEQPDGSSRVVDHEIIERPWDDGVEIQETDRLFLSVDDPKEPGRVQKRNLSMAHIVHAAGRAIRGDGAHIDEESARDMAREDLGYADAIAADVVLQLACFEEIVYG